MAAGPSRETQTRYPRDDVPPRPPGTPPAAGDWRSAVRTASGLNLLAGIWLIVAPLVLGYGDGDPYWNDIVFGAIVGVLALARLSGAYRAAWLSWVNALIGAWLFISAWWLDDTSTAAWNDAIAGAVIFVPAIFSASASDEAAARSMTTWSRR